MSFKPPAVMACIAEEAPLFSLPPAYDYLVISTLQFCASYAMLRECAAWQKRLAGWLCLRAWLGLKVRGLMHGVSLSLFPTSRSLRAGYLLRRRECSCTLRAGNWMRRERACLAMV